MFQVSKGKNPIKSSHHPWSIILSKNPLQDTILVSILPITGPWLLAFCELSLLPQPGRQGMISVQYFFRSFGKKKRSKEKHLLNCFECDRWWCIWYICTHTSFIQIPVVPGQAGGGSFKEKNYKSKKEFAYRMRARRPTSAMPKPFLCCSMVVMWPVLMSRSCLRREMK